MPKRTLHSKGTSRGQQAIQGSLRSRREGPHSSVSAFNHVGRRTPLVKGRAAHVNKQYSFAYTWRSRNPSSYEDTSGGAKGRRAPLSHPHAPQRPLRKPARFSQSGQGCRCKDKALATARPVVQGWQPNGSSTPKKRSQVQGSTTEQN